MTLLVPIFDNESHYLIMMTLESSPQRLDTINVRCEMAYVVVLDWNR
jgi:hypothetical protein